jgi:UDP-glucose 4-epimerase
MRYLVTGGAGFIGSNIVRQILSLGHQPVVLDNLTSGYSENLLPTVEFIHADIRDAAALARAVQGVRAVFHLAASVGNTRSIEHPLEDTEVNALGTLCLLEAARAAGVDKIVFSSSAGTFGELKTLPIAEDHPQEPDSPYGVSKLHAEKMCLAYNKLYGMHNVCLRYFNVYGPNQRYDAYGNVIPIFVNRVLQNRPITIFGDGEQTRDFVNVKDVVSANLNAAIKQDASGVFNIGSGTRITINELARLVQKVSGKSVEIVHTSPRIGDVRDSLAEISAARRVLGYQPAVEMEPGLVEYWDWICQDPVTMKQSQVKL